MDELEKLRKERMQKLLERNNDKGVIMDKPMELTDGNFKETVKNNQLVVVDFWAGWCMPCKMIAPVIDELAKDYAGRILFGKLNVDANRQVPGQFNVMSIPTLLVFKNGELVDQITGAQPGQTLEPLITRHLDA